MERVRVGQVGQLRAGRPVEGIDPAAHYLSGPVRVAALGQQLGQAYTNPSLLALLVEGMKGRIQAAPALSPQELHAFTLYASGLPLKTVARRLNVTINTAKQYINRVRRKYDAVGRMAPTKAELCLRAVEDGWLGGKQTGSDPHRNMRPPAAPAVVVAMIRSRAGGRLRPQPPRSATAAGTYPGC